MYSMSTPDTQLFAVATSKTTEKSLYNLQKNKKNTTLRTISTISYSKDLSVCCNCECLSGYHKIKLMFLLCHTFYL